MELSHTFTVPASVEDTWEAFTDLEMVAGCFPGASLTSTEGDVFQGSCKVRLGPIALVYSGTGTFVQRDETTHRLVIEAMGKEKRGNGTAGATVTTVLTSATPDSTDVEVATDLSITGKPAQFGRGVMQDVSDKLLRQFVTCLESKVGVSDVAVPAGETASPPSSEAPETAHASEATETTPETAPRESNEALDLGAAVLPVLVRSYGKQIAVALAVLFVLSALKRLARRRSQ